MYNKNINTKFPKIVEKDIEQEIKEKYDKNVERIVFCCFDKERELLEDFVTYWEHNYPDIVTGWNINKFDILYLVNRIIRILGDRTTISSLANQ